MKEKETSDKYEVGYGKPPRATQFQKGASGNPTGRPKKTPDFLSLFTKESRVLIPINENGRRSHIMKQQAVIKKLYNLAMTGNIAAARLVLAHQQLAQERDALSSAQLAGDLDRFNNVANFTDEELERLMAFLDKRDKKNEPGSSKK